MERERSQVPFLVLRCTEYLERNLDEEGILRLSGSTVEMQDIRTQIEQGNHRDFMEFSCGEENRAHELCRRDN